MTANCGGATPNSSTTSSSTTTASAPSSAPQAGDPTRGNTDAPGRTGSTYVPSPEPELTVSQGTGKTERLSGVIAAGTESSCRLLQLGAGTAVQVIGGDERLRVGAQVTVEGRRVPGMATTCQEGTPFVVSAVISATPAP